MVVTTEQGNRTNIWAKEPVMEIMEVNELHSEKAERLNGRFAMMGIIAALGAYAVTGQIIPGVWWLPVLLSLSLLAGMDLDFTETLQQMENDLIHMQVLQLTSPCPLGPSLGFVTPLVKW